MEDEVLVGNKTVDFRTTGLKTQEFKDTMV